MLPNTQLPPTRSDFSNQSNAIPRWWSAFAAAMPEDPAPMTQTVDVTATTLPLRAYGRA
jgi:hypothetical protein